jgi:hypothetical protein
MSTEDRAFFDSCDESRAYNSLDEYTADIRRWLILSSWQYSEEQADKLLADPIRKAWVQEAFEKREPVSDIASDVGYCCG